MTTPRVAASAKDGIVACAVAIHETIAEDSLRMLMVVKLMGTMMEQTCAHSVSRKDSASNLDSCAQYQLVFIYIPQQLIHPLTVLKSNSTI